jgi:uncharacterized membrane protein YcaP (DUF421 family)
MSKFQRAARKATATFLFASLGQVIAVPILDIDVAVWKLAVATGVGSLLNLVYRWAEKAKDDPTPNQ